MKKNILFILLSLSIDMYGQKIPTMQKEATGKEYHIDIYSAFQKKIPILKASQFVEDIEFVPLEITDDCLLDEFLKKIVVTKEFIFVYDYNLCYRFDRKGKFLNKIGARGNGPGEYVKAMSISIDTINKWVYMSDNWQYKFVKYDYSGKHLEDIKHKRSDARSIYSLKPFDFLVDNQFYQFAEKGERFCFYYYSEKQKKFISKISCDYPYSIPKMSICQPIAYRHKENLYTKDFWCDTIYRVVDPYHLESVAIIDRGKFEDYKYDDKSLTTGKEDNRHRMVLGINRIEETDRYLLMASHQGFAIHDKKSKMTYAGDSDENKLCVVDDLYGGPGFRGDHFPSCVQGNEYYTFRHAYEFIEKGKGKHGITDARYDAYCKMVEGLNSEDNPVIMIVKLKK